MFLPVSLFLSLASLACPDARQPDTACRYPWVHQIGADLGYDFVASSISDEMREQVPANKRVSATSSLPVSLRYAFSFSNPNLRNYFPGGYQGISVGMMNVGIANAGGVGRISGYIGNPVVAYVFQGAPFWKISNHLSLDYEWNFGASFGWKPYCDANKYLNVSVGSRVNAYLNISMFLTYDISRHIALTGGLGLSHFSNGNTSWPNPGVNSIGLKVGIRWTFNPLLRKFPQSVADTIKRRKTEFDITLWGASRKRVYRGNDNPVLLNGHYACAGLSFAPMVRLIKWVRVGGGMDLQWDESSNLKKHYVEGYESDDIRFTRPGFGSQLSLGLSAHGELQMPVFAVNIGMGYNLLAPEENRGSYQNITLKTYFTRNIYLNVGYQLRNFRQQANLMLGMGLTL